VATHPFDQSRYQVRLDWGVDGLARLAPSDVVIVVDVLRFSTTVTDAVSRGESVPLDDSAGALSIDGAVVAADAVATGALVLLGCLRNPTAVATAVHALQEQRAARTTVAVIACGERTGRDGRGPVRVAVEDQLGAGAIVDALSTRGIDHSSPEAAVAGEAFRGLRRATKHLLTSSGSGQELIDRGHRDEVVAASELDATDAVAVLRNGIFVRMRADAA
jgi:2-phosphosulfolactate phosphatase